MTRWNYTIHHQIAYSKIVIYRNILKWNFLWLMFNTKFLTFCLSQNFFPHDIEKNFMINNTISNYWSPESSISHKGINLVYTSLYICFMYP